MSPTESLPLLAARASPWAGTLGAVVALVSLSSSPLYTVEIGGGLGDVHVLEADLAEA
jgi:hypothetical protein